MHGQEQLRGGLGPGGGFLPPKCEQVCDQDQHSKESLEEMLSSAAVRQRGGRTKKPVQRSKNSLGGTGVRKHPWGTPAMPAWLSSLLWSSSPWAGAPSAGLATEDAHSSSAGRGEISKARSFQLNNQRGCSKANTSTSSPASPLHSTRKPASPGH